MSNIEQRLAKLERENRWLKVGSVLLVVGALGCGAAVAKKEEAKAEVKQGPDIAQVKDELQKQIDDLKQQVESLRKMPPVPVDMRLNRLFAKAIFIEDEDNKMRGGWAVGPNGACSLLVFARGGKETDCIRLVAGDRLNMVSLHQKIGDDQHDFNLFELGSASQIEKLTNDKTDWSYPPRKKD
jgi:hypothetical protein